MQRRYIFDNIINFRELGGYPCRGGATVFGKAFRCGIPKTPTENDIEVLKSLNIKTVIDIRGNAEAEDMPSFFRDSPDFDYYHISLFDANPAFAAKCRDMKSLYINCLEGYGENIAQVLKIILTLREPFVIHCFLGKDRTGILSALLLLAAGAAKEDIIADYQVSYTYIADFVRTEAASGSGLIWETDENNLRSLPEHMESAVDYINEKYGGIGGYLKHIGISEADIMSISEVLTDVT